MFVEKHKQAGPDAGRTFVYIVDDDPGVRDSTAVLLSSAGFAAQTFASGEDFLAAAPKLQPGCLVCDVRMPRLDGIALLNRLKALHLNFPSVVITGHGDVRSAVDAIKAGASDFLEKPYSGEGLLEALHHIAGRIRSADLDARTAAARISGLTTREREVLERLAAGMPNKIIAHDLAISIRTVEFYRTRVMKKLRVTSLSALIRLVLTAGIDIKLGR